MLRNMLALKRPANATLMRVDPVICTPWPRHNRDYLSLTAENCADLIEGLIAMGRQEFPAIVRRIPATNQFEIICGARRHWAVTWLRANGHPDFKYFIDVRDMPDDEAFRLADIENRDRSDLSDYERSVDYAEALEIYYGGSQKQMAEALQVQPRWLSRQLSLAALPADIVSAFPAKTEIRQAHARTLHPLLADPDRRARILEAAATLATEQKARRFEEKKPISTSAVFAALKTAAGAADPAKQVFARQPGAKGITCTTKRGKVILEFPDDISRYGLNVAFKRFATAHFGAADPKQVSGDT